MNKLLVALGLAATVALVGCNKKENPETGATTGEHLENAATQAGHDMEDATHEASQETDQAMDNAAANASRAADEAAAATSRAADATAEAAKTRLLQLPVLLKKVQAKYVRKLKINF